MGHSTVTLTVSTYGHVGEESGRRAADLLGAHLAPDFAREGKSKVS